MDKYLNNSNAFSGDSRTKLDPSTHCRNSPFDCISRLNRIEFFRSFNRRVVVGRKWCITWNYHWHLSENEKKHNTFISWSMHAGKKERSHQKIRVTPTIRNHELFLSNVQLKSTEIQIKRATLFYSNAFSMHIKRCNALQSVTRTYNFHYLTKHQMFCRFGIARHCTLCFHFR